MKPIRALMDAWHRVIHLIESAEQLMYRLERMAWEVDKLVQKQKKDL